MLCSYPFYFILFTKRDHIPKAWSKYKKETRSNLPPYQLMGGHTCVIGYLLEENFTYFKEGKGRGREEGWEYRGRGGKGPNFIAKFGRYVSIIGASEDPEKNIS
jgi:hypothetical protein